MESVIFVLHAFEKVCANVVNLSSTVQSPMWVRACLYDTFWKMMVIALTWICSSFHMCPESLMLVNQAGHAYSNTLLITLV